MNGVIYELTCKTCGDIYVGETTRGLAHVASQPRTTHIIDAEKHHVDTMHAAVSTPPAFKMRVTGVFGGDATKRLVNEAVKIKHTSGQMNRQEEWRQIRLPLS